MSVLEDSTPPVPQGTHPQSIVPMPLSTIIEGSIAAWSYRCTSVSNGDGAEGTVEPVESADSSSGTACHNDMPRTRPISACGEHPRTIICNVRVLESVVNTDVVAL